MELRHVRGGRRGKKGGIEDKCEDLCLFVSETFMRVRLNQKCTPAKRREGPGCCLNFVET